MKIKEAIGKLSIVFILIFIGGSIYLFRASKVLDVVGVRIHDHDLQVLVAETITQKHKGLGKRDTLDPYDGMLFSYKKAGRYGIVMRDMRFPIDVVWLNDAVIIDMAAHVALEPGVKEWELTPYYPRGDADVFIEFPAGAIEKYGMALGDTFEPIYQE
ncbi:DUF192 domain-containing protein [Patescibacteria group bacterium]|nr:DUF192 domain-containing protein [Patescibacteria group bacterium]MBU1721408.1 DUF192 domain-containing protein [Patescibacteria group bacterium]MBU1901848.1 DUF192 domain-containing protein [Patescibacteria group bacterium]